MSEKNDNNHENASVRSVSEELTLDDFAAFFRDIHGEEPFPWQQRLMAHVLNHQTWPKVVDLPTGVGKTAVLDIAVFSIAAQPDVAPRRIVFVIDRRIVVDQVYSRAEKIRACIQSGRTKILSRIKQRLDDLSDGNLLGVSALRGGIAIDNEWAHHPDQPWVIVSTVDQFGSRLLFRGYGVTQKMRPIHAGLAGNDCLVILDEVHLSTPFAETLANVTALEFSSLLPRRYAVVEMSATPNDNKAERFVLDPTTDLKECDELSRRINAAKEASLVTARHQDDVPNKVVEIVRSITKSDPDVRSVGVVVNMVRTARETYQALRRADYEPYIITGRMRPLDRVDVLEDVNSYISPIMSPPADKFTVVVATQAIEVGADFSFDALITECAPIDSLRQRFGRLDRRGNYSTQTKRAARSWIIGLKSNTGPKKTDLIYGESVAVTWSELQKRSKNGTICVGSLSLDKFPHGATAPRDKAPLLLKTHMDAWVQTNPEPITQPRIDWFLHGMKHHSAPDVSIVWRRDRSRDALMLVPPRQPEFLPVPLNAAKAWLGGGDEMGVADVDGDLNDADDVPSPPKQSTAPNCVIWRGFDKILNPTKVDEISPGDIVIVDPGRGGLSGATWDPSSTDLVEDLGDRAQYTQKVTLRLDPDLLCKLGVDSLPMPTDEEKLDLPINERIVQWLRANHDRLPKWMQTVVETLGEGFDKVIVGDKKDGLAYAGGYYILSKHHPRTKKSIVDAAVMDGSDSAGSLVGTGVLLSCHLNGVGGRAASIAARLGLPTNLVEDLRLAGRLHDIGKADPRFQAQLTGGDPVRLAIGHDLLAKSLPGIRQSRFYPKGMRHEVASVAMLESNRDALDTAKDKDLVLYLIGTHHGWGRPMLPVISDPEPHMIKYEFEGHSLTLSLDLVHTNLALDMASRFWRLVDRYGYYGLSWLESIIRLADHLQSAEEAAQA